MKHRIFLDGGPIQHLELTGDEDEIASITAIDIEVAEKIDTGSDARPVSLGVILKKLTLASHHYERLDSWPADDEQEIQHSFYYLGTQRRKRALPEDWWASFLDRVGHGEAANWNQWRWTLIHSLESGRKAAGEEGCQRVAEKLDDVIALALTIPSITRTR